MPSILITGVSSGLGHALALRAHSAGWRVTGTVRDDTDTQTHGLPSDITLYRLELRFPHAVSAFTQRFVADNGVPDVLVNNAAYVIYGPTEEIPPEAVRDLFQVNAFSAVELASAMLPAMRERGSGTIVNVTSIGGRFVFPFFSAYNATKHALEGFSEGLWHEVKPFGVRVKVVEPGYIETPIYAPMQERAEPTGPYARYLEAMNTFGAGVKKRSTPAAAADEVWRAIMDPSDRLRYPVAAYARVLLRARALLGGRLFMHLMHPRWMGKDL